MAEMNFGGVVETVVTSKEFSLEKAREVLKNETIAILGYGIQGPGQAGNLRDNGFNVIVGQRPGKTYDKAVADGWVPGETLFSIEEAAQKGTIICMLLSDAGQIAVWPKIKQYLTAGKTLYYSHGFAINWNDRTGVVPPADVIMVAPKGSGTSLRTMFLEGRGLNTIAVAKLKQLLTAKQVGIQVVGIQSNSLGEHSDGWNIIAIANVATSIEQAGTTIVGLQLQYAGAICSNNIIFVCQICHLCLAHYKRSIVRLQLYELAILFCRLRIFAKLI